MKIIGYVRSNDVMNQHIIVLKEKKRKENNIKV